MSALIAVRIIITSRIHVHLRHSDPEHADRVYVQHNDKSHGKRDRRVDFWPNTG